MLVYNVLDVECMGLFFLRRGCIAFIRLSEGFLTSNRLKKNLYCHQVFCDLQSTIQIKYIVFIQKTPRELNVAFFFFPFLRNLWFLLCSLSLLPRKFCFSHIHQIAVEEGSPPPFSEGLEQGIAKARFQLLHL